MSKGCETFRIKDYRVWVLVGYANILAQLNPSPLASFVIISKFGIISSVLFMEPPMNGNWKNKLFKGYDALVEVILIIWCMLDVHPNLVHSLD